MKKASDLSSNAPYGPAWWISRWRFFCFCLKPSKRPPLKKSRFLGLSPPPEAQIQTLRAALSYHGDILYWFFRVLGVFWGLYSGTIIDKYNRKNILELINFYTGLFITSIGILPLLRAIIQHSMLHDDNRPYILLWPIIIGTSV